MIATTATITISLRVVNGVSRMADVPGDGIDLTRSGRARHRPLRGPTPAVALVKRTRNVPGRKRGRSANRQLSISVRFDARTPPWDRPMNDRDIDLVDKIVIERLVYCGGAS
jgi:hypothetical protein